MSGYTERWVGAQWTDSWLSREMGGSLQRKVEKYIDEWLSKRLVAQYRDGWLSKEKGGLGKIDQITREKTADQTELFERRPEE
jgi:hypothetical protein